MAKFSTYKTGFFINLLLLISSWAYFIISNNEKQKKIDIASTQIAEMRKDPRNAEIFEALFKLDSIKIENDSLATNYINLLSTTEVQINRDSLAKKLTEPQKRLLRLTDSINAIHDSINILNKNILQILRNTKLDETQSDQLNNTFAILANISVTLDFDLDNQRLNVLKANTNSLKTIVAKFDKKIEKLDKFSKLLESFSKYLQIGIDVFTAAVSQGLLTPKVAAAK